MNKVIVLVITAFLSLTMAQACTKEGVNENNNTDAPGVNTTPAALLETEWLSSKWAVWNSYRIYHNGEFYNPQTKVWYSGFNDPFDLEPDGGTGIYFGNKRFVSTVVSSASSGGGCRTNNAMYMEGVPAFEGNKLVFHITIKRGKSKSVCSPSGNYDKDFQTGKEEYTYAIGVDTDSDGFQYHTLTLTDVNNNSTVFYRRK